jgi:hypothetical protein
VLLVSQAPGSVLFMGFLIRSLAPSRIQSCGAVGQVACPRPSARGRWTVSKPWAFNFEAGALRQCVTLSLGDIFFSACSHALKHKASPFTFGSSILN